MDEAELKKMMKRLESLVLPSRECLLTIISSVKSIFEAEANIIEIQGNISIVGDVHGHFFDFLNLLDLVNSEYKILFLGDYVDRGYNSVELFLTLMIMKILSPNKVFLLRGNHENRGQTTAYGFKDECVLKYDCYIYWKICEVFELLPVAAVIDNDYFCVHGGIVPDLSYDWIRELDRVEEYAEISNILWADPSNEILEFEISPRGAGYIFGRLALESFLEGVGCKHLVRSHQLVYNGVKEHFEGKCITIWSAPNYCYKFRNIAAFMVIEDRIHKFVYFEAVKEQFKIENWRSTFFSQL